MVDKSWNYALLITVYIVHNISWFSVIYVSSNKEWILKFYLFGTSMVICPLMVLWYLQNSLSNLLVAKLLQNVCHLYVLASFAFVSNILTLLSLTCLSLKMCSGCTFSLLSVRPVFDFFPLHVFSTSVFTTVGVHIFVTLLQSLCATFIKFYWQCHAQFKRSWIKYFSSLLFFPFPFNK